MESNRGFHFLAEDIAIADQEYVYANAQTATFFYHINEFENSNFVKSISFKSMLSKVPFLPYYIGRPLASSISKLMKNVKVLEKARIKRIFILGRGESSLQSIGNEEALRRILIINRNEFSYHKNPVIFAYSYFNPHLDLNKLMKTDRR